MPSLLAALVPMVDVAGTVPWTPQDDAVVVARFRSGPTTAADRQLRSAGTRLAANPANLETALDVARRNLRQWRVTADPRFLGHAQTALTPWWTSGSPPVEVLVLRAMIRQSQHDFSGALADLDAAIVRAPRHVGAWLTKATIHIVRAEIAEARRSAAHLLYLADPLTATTIITQIAVREGQGKAACMRLDEALRHEQRRNGSRSETDAETLLWAETVLAEASSQAGDPASAERHFRAALERSPADPYLLGAYADFLLDQRRPAQVVTLLRDHAQIDALLLRLAEAERASGHPDRAAAATETLKARFAEARTRRDSSHRREEARFHLHLLHDAETALKLAEENWRVQKEPADARLLDEARQKAGLNPFH